MNNLRIILSDQLSSSISSLSDIEKTDTILFFETMEEATFVKHHPKKIAFLFAAMRHFSEELISEGFDVKYIKLDSKNNSGSIEGEVKSAIQELNPCKVIVTEPSQYWVLQIFESLKQQSKCEIEIRSDNRFLCSINEFKSWAKDKKQLRMEYFYRHMRKKYNILIEKDQTPTGGQWNYDKENRKPPKDGLKSHKRISHKKSEILKEVLALTKENFASHFGDLEPFHFAVTRSQALIELDQFIEEILPKFGDFQDAMVKGEAYLNHSLLSSYINVGLILPLEICKKAEKAFFDGKAPLNSVEGFIRQILGWREYVRGIYWSFMPEYKNMNYLEAKTPLPDFYWGAKTQMHCISDVVQQTKEHAYSHHIQRLMITGNFALIAGLDVLSVQEWYLAVYSDAFEWVEMPNTLGMALFGDGGILASKPYAASGKYINKMSNFCKNCKYNPEDTTEKNACPFNALYWDFLARNRSKLEGNQRLPYVYSTWDKFGIARQDQIRKKAFNSLTLMKAGDL
jgi:deoxyribodipyrimidine photolyase-related protein